MKFNIMNGDELVTTICASSSKHALHLLDDERSQPRGTVKSRGIKAVRAGIIAQTEVCVRTTFVDTNTAKHNERIISATIHHDGKISADCHIDFGGSLVWDFERGTLDELIAERSDLGYTSNDLATVRQNLRIARRATKKAQRS